MLSSEIMHNVWNYVIVDLDGTLIRENASFKLFKKLLLKKRTKKEVFYCFFKGFLLRVF